MALLAVAGQDIGKVYPGIQSGTAALTSGVAVIQFPKPFASVPTVMVSPITTTGGSLMPPTFTVTGISTTQASITGYEWDSLVGTGGSIAADHAAGSVAWLAFAVGRGN